MEETEPGTRLRRHCCGESGPAFTSQKLNGALLLITKARESFPFLKHYANTWPVTDAIIRYLANHRKYKKSKNAKKDKAGAGHENGDGEAPPPPGVAGGVGDGEGEDEDDVELSD